MVAYALTYPAWGHRKIWALTVADGHQVSMRTVHCILDERRLLNGRRYQAERRELASARKATFHDPPTRRNRVWQTDFSEFETRADGTWQLGGVVDYAAKFCLTRPVTASKTWREATAALEAARERADELLGAPLISDLVDRATGELEPIRVVTDNGPCYKAGAFARYIRSRPEFEHVRTRHRSPGTSPDRARVARCGGSSRVRGVGWYVGGCWVGRDGGRGVCVGVAPRLGGVGGQASRGAWRREGPGLRGLGCVWVRRAAGAR